MRKIQIVEADKEETRERPSVVDRRRINLDGVKSDAVEPNLKPSFVEQLEGRVHLAESRLRQRIEELDEEARRSRERVAADLELRFRDKEKAMLLDVLDILDDLGRASDHAEGSPAVLEGYELIRNRIRLFLEKHGCETVVPEGRPFDPETMEALQVTPGAEGAVTAVLSPGIFWHGDLLRPARVAVGKGGD